MEDLQDHTELGRERNHPISHLVTGCKDVHFSYSRDFILEIPRFDIHPGSKLAITGASGCGKTTFLKLLSGILRPDRGQIFIDGLELNSYSKGEVQDLRILKMGLVFQEFELLDYLTLIDNVTLPLRINPVLSYTPDTRKKAIELLQKVGLGDKVSRYPGKLSQGERQRVAVCRSMITSPGLLLCDEPTANLDRDNRDLIMGIILEYCSTQNTSLVMVTHDREILQHFDEQIDLETFRATPKIPVHEK